MNDPEANTQNERLSSATFSKERAEGTTFKDQGIKFIPFYRSHFVQSHISKAMGGVWSIRFGPTLFKDPWREVSAKYQDNLEFVKSYKPQNKQVKHLRILLHGPVGAGKSSFINSVDSVLKGRPAGRAMTDAGPGTSFTREICTTGKTKTALRYETFKFSRGPESTYSLVFNDIMGFEEGSDCGVSVEDVKLALRGHVEEGYRFNPERGLMEGDIGYNSHPTVEDKVHVLVCVVPVNSVSLLSDKIVKKMREVRLAASELGIPQLAILTKVDEACPKFARDSRYIYKSRYLKEQVDKFHMLLGLPLNCIFLVKNYDKETELNEGMSAVTVCALRQMVWFGEDFLNNLET